MDWTPSEQQERAINLSCDLIPTNKIVACTGAAGVGKTSIMRHVHDELSRAGYNVSIAAPTGKAAKRIKEATGIKAKTIHATLEYTHPGLPDASGKT
jgi:exodeoxyribonuclease V alpha subunit